MRGVDKATRRAQALRAAEARADGALRRPAAGPALGRPAAARGAGARADHRSAGAAARRAAVGARPVPAHQDARGAEGAADAARHQLHPRHPQPGRGDGAGRPGGGDERGQDRAGGHRRAKSSTGRHRPSSPGSSAATTCIPAAVAADRRATASSSRSAPTASPCSRARRRSTPRRSAGVTRSVEYLGSTVQVGIDVAGLEHDRRPSCRRRASTPTGRAGPAGGSVVDAQGRARPRAMSSATIRREGDVKMSRKTNGQGRERGRRKILKGAAGARGRRGRQRRDRRADDLGAEQQEHRAAPVRHRRVGLQRDRREGQGRPRLHPADDGARLPTRWCSARSTQPNSLRHRRHRVLDGQEDLPGQDPAGDGHQEDQAASTRSCRSSPPAS